MRLVIDIPENYYSACKVWKTMGVATTAEEIISNGTPYKERPKGYIRKLIAKYKWHRFCKLNGYRCPDCIYHDFIFDDGGVFRGNKCRYPDKGGKT